MLALVLKSERWLMFLFLSKTTQGLCVALNLPCGTDLRLLDLSVHGSSLKDVGVEKNANSRLLCGNVYYSNTGYESGIVSLIICQLFDSQVFLTTRTLDIIIIIIKFINKF